MVEQNFNWKRVEASREGVTDGKLMQGKGLHDGMAANLSLPAIKVSCSCSLFVSALPRDLATDSEEIAWDVGLESALIGHGR